MCKFYGMIDLTYNMNKLDLMKISVNTLKELYCQIKPSELKCKKDPIKEITKSIQVHHHMK